jgi:hypothetical protein
VLGISKRGVDLLHDPRINKSTGFTEAERQAPELVGLVPDVTGSIETQLSRVLLQLKDKATELAPERPIGCQKFGSTFAAQEDDDDRTARSSHRL